MKDIVRKASTYALLDALDGFNELGLLKFKLSKDFNKEIIA